MIPKSSKETHIKLLSQVLFNYINDYKADNYFTGKFKSFVNSFIIQLGQVEKKNFDRALEQQEEAATEVYNAIDLFTQTVSGVPVWDMPNITQVIKAYYLDPKSIEGITNKILR
jgi:hypothetical protein